jgi:hypothetical protein
LNLCDDKSEENDSPSSKKLINWMNKRLNNLNSNNLIDYMCSRFDGHSMEVKTIYEHYFKPQVRNLIEKGRFILVAQNGKPINNEDKELEASGELRLSGLAGCVTAVQTDSLLKCLNNEYENNHLNYDESDSQYSLDERILLLSSSHLDYSLKLNKSQDEDNTKWILLVPECLKSLYRNGLAQHDRFGLAKGRKLFGENSSSLYEIYQSELDLAQKLVEEFSIRFSQEMKTGLAAFNKVLNLRTYINSFAFFFKYKQKRTFSYILNNH